MIMRTVLCLIVLGAAWPAFAVSPCFTAESEERAYAVMEEGLRWPTQHPPLINGSLVLDFTGNEDLSITCEARDVTPSLYPIEKASLAWAAELRLCTPTNERFDLPLTFANG